MSEETLVSTKEVDFLDEDKPIRNQNYCLLSFLSPEDVLINKESYYFSRFINNLGKDVKTLLDNLEAKYSDSKDLIETIKNNHSYLFNSKELDEQYKFFKSVNATDIEKDFHRENNFTTSIRGIKVRGVFDTVEEAKNRCEFLKKVDNKFDIYISQVGCWCPWAPNPNDLENQEYSETQLNTLMKQYKQNMNERDEVFDKRKTDIIAASSKKTSDIATNLAEVDPWTAKKLTDNVATTTDETTVATDETTVATDETTVATDETPVVADETPATTDETTVAADETTVVADEIPSGAEETPATPDETPTGNVATPEG
jgi:hypothetical protein